MPLGIACFLLPVYNSHLSHLCIGTFTGGYRYNIPVPAVLIRQCVVDPNLKVLAGSESESEKRGSYSDLDSDPDTLFIRLSCFLLLL
jgi:hypothetical protein